MKFVAIRHAFRVIEVPSRIGGGRRFGVATHEGIRHSVERVVKFVRPPGIDRSGKPADVVVFARHRILVRTQNDRVRAPPKGSDIGLLVVRRTAREISQTNERIVTVVVHSGPDDRILVLDDPREESICARHGIQNAAASFLFSIASEGAIIAPSS